MKKRLSCPLKKTDGHVSLKIAMLSSQVGHDKVVARLLSAPKMQRIEWARALVLLHKAIGSRHPQTWQEDASLLSRTVDSKLKGQRRKKRNLSCSYHSLLN
jgi:hypothetical protein